LPMTPPKPPLSSVTTTLPTSESTTRSNGTSWTHSLEDYALAFQAAGLLVEVMREPRPSGASPRYERWKRVPMFLLIVAIKTSATLRPC
jgi:hypothetical protein